MKRVKKKNVGRHSMAASSKSTGDVRSSRLSKTRQDAASTSSGNPVLASDRVAQFYRSRFNPIRSLDPDLLSKYMDSYKAGFIRQLALIWEAIEERDDTLSSVIPKRKAAASRHGWEVLTLASIPDSMKDEAAKHKAVLEAFYNNLTVTNAIDENERGETSLLTRQMMDCVGHKYAVHEIVWRPILDAQNHIQDPGLLPPGSSLLTADFRYVPLYFFENTTGNLKYLETEGAIFGVELNADDWMITASAGPGLMFACAIAYMYKNLSLKDWIIYNERHGMPGLHGKTNANPGTPEWAVLSQALQSFSSDWAILTNEGATIDKLDMATTGQLPYPPLVERMDRAMAAIWRGADLSTLSGKVAQGGQGASLQSQETEVLEEDDVKFLSETLSRSVDRRVIEYVFGEGVDPLAYIKIKSSQKKDTELDLKIDGFMITAGVPIGVQSILERYNRPMPDPEDKLLTPPQPTANGLQPSSASVPAIPPGQNAGGAPGSPPGVKTGSASPASAGSLSNQRSAVSGQRSADPSTVEAASSRLSTTRQDAASTMPDHPAIGRLLATARMELAAAQDKVLQPLRARLETIMQLPDAEVEPALRGLQSELPDLLKTMNAHPATVKVLQDTLSAALLSGLMQTEVSGQKSEVGDQNVGRHSMAASEVK